MSSWFEAAEAGDFLRLQALRAGEAIPQWDAQDDRPHSRGLTALSLASRGGHLAAVEFLIGVGADPERADAEAPRPGLKQFVQFAGESALEGEPLGRTALFWAVLGGHREVVGALLQAGANPQRVDFLGYHPLFLAAGLGHLAMLEMFLNAGVPIDFLGPSKRTALLEAISSQQPQCALFLLERGASVKVRSGGSTPLLEAAGQADAELLRGLLAAGAPWKVAKKTLPALVRVAGASHRVPLKQAPPGNWAKIFNDQGAFALVPRPAEAVLEAVEVLLGAGAQVDEMGPSGTALMAAARHGQLEVVERLLQAGADPELRHEGKTALDLAMLYGFGALADRLQTLTHSHPQPLVPPAPAAVEVELPLPDFHQAARSPEFIQVLAELEQLCGQAPRTPPELRGGREFAIPPALQEAWSTLDLQRSFLPRGVYLFEPAYAKRAGALVVLPSSRWQDALALMQTNGSNAGQTPYKVLQWMEALYSRQPFELQTVSHDTLSGVFLGPIARPKALAEAMAEFCDDIIEQGCGSVSALARELRKRPARLFFWWD